MTPFLPVKLKLKHGTFDALAVLTGEYYLVTPLEENDNGQQVPRHEHAVTFVKEAVDKAVKDQQPLDGDGQ